MNDANAVLAANAAFYDAHESRDLAAMQAVWEHSDRGACTHPGGPILRGWAEVETSWRQILEGPGRNQFIITNDTVEVVGEVAWVTCDENLVAPGSTLTVAATNVFVRDQGRGRLMVNHHGSPVEAEALASCSMRIRPGRAPRCRCARRSRSCSTVMARAPSRRDHPRRC